MRRLIAVSALGLGFLLVVSTITPERVDANGGSINVIGGTGVISSEVFDHLATCTQGSMGRIAGLDRYATAAGVSQTMWPTGATRAYVATGENFPDAVGAGSLAALADAPILLTRRDTLPGATSAELVRLGVTDIVVLGGTAAVSDAVATSLASYGSVSRIAGSNRFSTAAAISASGDSLWVKPGLVYVATGENFPDALAGSVGAALAKAPVLLVSRDAIPSETAAELTRLAPKQIVILGGSGVVSDAVQTQLGVYAATVRRLAGANRYATAAAVSKDTFPSSLAAIIATGENFPDALVGGAGAAKWQVPILLVTKYTVPANTAAELSRLTGVPCSPFVSSPTPPTTTTTTVSVPPNPGDSKNCGDFSTWSQAQAWHDLYFPYYGDIANLDGNGDGIACESLPGAP